MRRQGFAVIIILLIVVVALAIAGGVWYYISHQVSAPRPLSALNLDQRVSSGSSQSIANLVSRIKGSDTLAYADVIKYEVDGQYLFIGHRGYQVSGGSIAIYDTNAPSSTTPIATYTTAPYLGITDFLVTSKYLFIVVKLTHLDVTVNPTLDIVDISDPHNPQLVAEPSVNGGEEVTSIESDGENIVLNGKTYFSGKSFGSEALGFSQIVDVSDIHNLKILNPLPTPEIFYNPNEGFFDPNGALLQWKEGDLQYAIVDMMKSYSFDANKNIIPVLDFSIFVTNYTSATKTAMLDIKEIDQSGNIIAGSAGRPIMIGPGEQARGQTVQFMNPGANFTTGGNSDIHFTVQLINSDNLATIPASPTLPATSTAPLIRAVAS